MRIILDKNDVIYDESGIKITKCIELKEGDIIQFPEPITCTFSKKLESVDFTKPDKEDLKAVASYETISKDKSSLTPLEFKIFRFLKNNSELIFSPAEIAKQTGTKLNSLYSTLCDLTNIGLILRKEVGKYQYNIVELKLVEDSNHNLCVENSI